MSHKLDHMHLMSLFVAIVRQGSFAAAAKQLNITATKASKDIRYLEQTLDTQLLNRTTRSVNLTCQGELYFKTAVEIVELYEQTLDTLAANKLTLSGELRITAPQLWGTHVLTPILLKFKTAYPNVSLIADYSNATADLVRDNLHVAFRSTKLKDEPYLARYIADDNQALCASSGYLTQAGMVQTLKDLDTHQLITLNQNHSSQNTWTFSDKGQNINYHCRGALAMSSKDAIFQAVKQNFGISLLPEYLIAADIEQGNLQRVLPHYQLTTKAFYALYTQRRKDSALVNRFIDFVIEAIKSQ